MIKTRSIPMLSFSAIALVFGVPDVGWGADDSITHVDLSRSAVGYFALGIFVLAYALVMAEEFTQLRKSKPVMLAAGIIWAIVAWSYPGTDPHAVEHALRHNILEYAELMLFLLAAMTYINAMEERLVFESLRSWLVRKGFTYRQLFWLTGILAFFISPVADNLTTALLMCAVVWPSGRTILGLSVWRVSISWWRPTRAGPSALLATSPR